MRFAKHIFKSTGWLALLIMFSVVAVGQEEGATRITFGPAMQRYAIAAVGELRRSRAALAAMRRPCLPFGDGQAASRIAR